MKKKRILVVEDSITSRTVLRIILESKGYDVTTACDGLDGLTAVKKKQFDLAVVDIEMPRLNGFDLTEKIRENPVTAEIPVVMLTALESREDRERATEVGANGYVVKLNFQQDTLLRMIRQLLNEPEPTA